MTPPLTLVEPLLTVAEVKGILRLSRTKIYDEVTRGELVAFKLNRKTLFRASDVQAYIDRHLTKPVEKASAKVKGI